MKQASFILALGLAALLAACSQEAPPPEPVEMEEPAAMDQPVDQPPIERRRRTRKAIRSWSRSLRVRKKKSPTTGPSSWRRQTPPAADRDWQYSEGQHYKRLVPTQPTVGGSDKIEVAEFFWYGCNHCFDFEPYINRWAEDVPDGSRFVRVHTMWNPLVRTHAQLFYTEEVLANNGKLEDRDGFRNAVFLEIHRRGNLLNSESAIFEVFDRFGVAEADFKSTWGSFEVAQKMRVADDLARRYGVSSVPMVVVNGKYRTSAGDAGQLPEAVGTD